MQTKYINMKKAELYNSKFLNDLFDSIDPAEAKKVEDRMILAAKIDDAMKAKGLSKSQFAELIGKEISVITDWLSGTYDFTDNDLLIINRVLKIQLNNIKN